MEPSPAAVVSLFLVFTAGPATAKEFATLHVFDGSVQVHITGTDGFVDGRDGQAMHAGDVVQTGDDGRAEILYFDGSVSRLDFNTTFRLRELSTIQNKARSKVILASEEGGQSFNRITKLTDSQSRVEVATPTATASVQGTEFVVAYIDQQSQVLVVHGLVAVHVGKHVILVPTGHKVVVLHNGTVGPVVELTDADLHSDFLNFNQCTVDQVRQCPHHAPHHHRSTHHHHTGNTGPVAPTGAPPFIPTPPGPPTPPETDTNAPDTSITSGPNGAVPSGEATFQFDSSEPGSTFECALDNDAYDACDSPKTYSGLADGEHTFAVSATDSSGNTDDTPADRKWTVDTTPPDAPVIGSGPGNPTNQTGATFTFGPSSASRATAGGSSAEHFQCSLDGADFHNCNSPKTYGGLAEGAHGFVVQAVDEAGNTGQVSYNWAIDLTPPAAPVIDASPKSKTKHKDASFSFHGGGSRSSAGASDDSFECSVDGESFSVCSSPRSYNGLGKGHHGFSVLARDAAGNASAPATYGWDIDDIVAHDDAYATAQGLALNVSQPGVLGNDEDPDGDPLTAVLDGGVSHGTLTLGPDGSVLYTPNAGFFGADNFTYHATDGTVSSEGAVVKINVKEGDNEPPTAADDAYGTDEDTPLAVEAPGVLDNDSDPDADPIHAVLDSGPSHEDAFALHADGSFSYTPESDFDGSDTFTYHASDGSGASSPATVTIEVDPANDPPTAAGSSYQTDEDTPVTVTLAGSDVDGDPLTFSVGAPEEEFFAQAAGPSSGTLSDFSAPSCANGFCTETAVYTPGTDFNGTDSFDFTVNDGQADSDPATMSITVGSDNDPPTAATGSDSTNEDTAKTLTLAGTDVDGDSLTFTKMSSPSHGTLGTIGAPTCLAGSCTATVLYTPAENYHGSDSFTFKVNDGHVDSNIATVSLTVNSVNDAPLAYDNSVTATQGVGLPITLTGTDADGDATTFAIVTGPTHGSLGSISSPSCSGGTPNTCTASVTYTGTSTGSDSFTYKVNDGQVDSPAGTVTITVNAAANTGPIAVADFGCIKDATGVGGQSTTIHVTANDTDPDGDTITLEGVVSPPSHGSAQSVGGGNIKYTVTSTYLGLDSFTYRINDGHGHTADGTVTVSIQTTNCNG